MLRSFHRPRRIEVRIGAMLAAVSDEARPGNVLADVSGVIEARPRDAREAAGALVVPSVLLADEVATVRPTAETRS